MKKKHLEGFLQQLETFGNPKIELEQYGTGVSLASSILNSVEETTGFEDTFVGDLGLYLNIQGS